MIRKVKEKQVDEYKLETRVKYIDIEVNIILEEIQQRLLEVMSRFKKLIQTDQEIREKEILDYHHIEVPNSTEKERKIRKSIM